MYPQLSPEPGVDPARRARLVEEFSSMGPLLGGRALLKALAYDSAEALRQAKRRGKVPVKLIELEGRRGSFAYTMDVIDWLVRLEAPCASSAPPSSLSS